MLPYNNTGKYHETPEAIPMLHTIDHSLTETMFSLSPSSQFMYEPEGIESVTCGQSQGFAGPPVLDMTSGDEYIKSEGIISPSMEGMTFQDCMELDGLFGPPTEGLGFKDCFELHCNFTPSASGMAFEGAQEKPDGMFCMSSDGLEFDDCEKMGQAYRTPIEGVSFADGGKENGGGFNVLSEALSFETCSKLNDLIPAMTTTSSDVDGLTSDWFKLEKDIFEISKENDELMQDPVFGGGPTLAQLNSKDLDSAFLDEYKILEDLYASSAAFTCVDQSPAVTSLEPVSTKFVPGGAAGIGSATVPKFTTCTITSFVTTVSTSGMAPPLRFPAFVTSDLLSTGRQEPCYLGSTPPEGKPDVSMRDQLAELMGPGGPLTSTYANQCFVPMLAGGAQAVQLVGTVVVPTVSLMVPEVAPPPKPTFGLPELPPDEVKPAKRSLEQNWEMEHYIKPTELRVTAAIGSAEFSQGTKSQDVAFNPSEELSDREDSGLLDSDIENAEFDHSDEESVYSKSEHADDFIPSSRKEKKYFWQYNTQSKGPKGKRLCKSVETEDPHVLHDFEDPVFDPEQNQTRYKHNGKARRGDGNDVTPNPHKLFVTGNELKKLNKLINDITPSSEMPASARAKMLKEKNKFASRACRLKKKAQHEANKLKLHGLELEHRQLMKVLGSIKREIFQRVNRKDGLAKESLSSRLESLVQQHITTNVAGHTADYVNLVLQKVAKGDRTGGVTVDD